MVAKIGQEREQVLKLAAKTVGKPLSARAAKLLDTVEADTETEAGADTDTGAETETEADTETETEAEAAARETGQPRGSIAAVGERLGQRVAHVGEAAGDRVQHAGEVAGQRVAHAGEAAGQRVILASEAAEGTVVEAQTRAAHATQRITEQAGQLAGRIKHSALAPARQQGARAVQAVRKNRRTVFAGSALVGLMAAIRRRGKRSGGGS